MKKAFLITIPICLLLSNCTGRNNASFVASSGFFYEGEHLIIPVSRDQFSKGSIGELDFVWNAMKITVRKTGEGIGRISTPLEIKSIGPGDQRIVVSSNGSILIDRH